MSTSIIDYLIETEGAFLLMNIYIVLHIVLVVLAMFFFLFAYKKEKKIHQMILLFWIPFTLTRYITQNTTFLNIIGIIQIILFVLVLFFMFKPVKKVETNYPEILDAKEDQLNNSLDHKSQLDVAENLLNSDDFVDKE